MPPDNRADNPRFSGKRLAWVLISLVCGISLALSAFSADNYMDIAKAKILSYVETTETTALQFDVNGSLSSVNLTLEFRIVNPSDKELRTWILTYKGWLRDTPMEDGTDTSRWMIDGRLEYNGTEMRFYPVFVTTYSLDNPSVIVPARSEITVTRWLDVNRGNYPDIMSNMADIYNHTASGGQELEWMHYTSSILFIQGIEQYAGPNHDANLIRRFEGIDLTPGVGGAG